MDERYRYRYVFCNGINNCVVNCDAMPASRTSIRHARVRFLNDEKKPQNSKSLDQSNPKDLLSDTFIGLTAHGLHACITADDSLDPKRSKTTTRLHQKDTVICPHSPQRCFLDLDIIELHHNMFTIKESETRVLHDNKLSVNPPRQC